MGFMERMAEIMKPVSTRPETETTMEKSALEGNSQSDQTTETEVTNGDNASDEASSPKEKTYSEEEMENLMEERRKTWETERMNMLSKESQIEELKAEILKRDIKEKVNARLEEVKLPLDVTEFLQYTDEAGTMENLEKVITTIDQLVRDGINLRLRGKTPEGLHTQGELDPFAKSLTEAMKR